MKNEPTKLELELLGRVDRLERIALLLLTKAKVALGAFESVSGGIPITAPDTAGRIRQIALRQVLEGRLATGPAEIREALAKWLSGPDAAEIERTLTEQQAAQDAAKLAKAKADHEAKAQALRDELEALDAAG